MMEEDECVSLGELTENKEDELRLLEAQLDSESVGYTSSCPSINLDTPKPDEIEDSDEDDGVNVTIKPSVAPIITPAEPCHTQQRERVKLSGAGKKRLKRLLEQGVNKEEAYRLAQKPGETPQPEPAKRPRADLSSGENKPQPKRVKSTTTPAGRPQKSFPGVNRPKTSVNNRLERGGNKGTGSSNNQASTTISRGAANSKPRNREVQGRMGQRRPAHKPLYTEVINQIRIGIISKNYPETTLTTLQLKSAHDAIMERVLEQRRAPVKPTFRGCSLKSGFMVINCCDQATADWLKGITSSLQPWEGAELIAVEEKNIPRSEILIAYLPNSATRSNENIVAYIESQNDLNTDSWRILQRTALNEGDVELVLTVDEESMQKLEGMGFRINYLYNTAKLRRKRNRRSADGSENSESNDQQKTKDTDVANDTTPKNTPGNQQLGPNVDRQQQIPGPSRVEITSDIRGFSSKAASQRQTSETYPKHENNRAGCSSVAKGIHQSKVPEYPPKPTNTQGYEIRPVDRQLHKGGSPSK